LRGSDSIGLLRCLGMVLTFRVGLWNAWWGVGIEEAEMLCSFAACIFVEWGLGFFVRFNVGFSFFKLVHVQSYALHSFFHSM